MNWWCKVYTWDGWSEGTITHHHASSNQHKAGDDCLRNGAAFQELEHPWLQAVLFAVELEVGIWCQPSDRHRHRLAAEIDVLAQERVQGKGTTCTYKQDSGGWKNTDGKALTRDTGNLTIDVHAGYRNIVRFVKNQTMIGNYEYILPDAEIRNIYPCLEEHFVFEMFSKV